MLKAAGLTGLGAAASTASIIITKAASLRTFVRQMARRLSIDLGISDQSQ
jgi:hypothetical protein